MVSTRSRRSPAVAAAATSIPAARALRRERRARQAEAEILGEADPFKKPPARKRGRKARIPSASGSQLQPVSEEAPPRLLATPPPLSQQSVAAPPHSQGAWPGNFGPPQSQGPPGQASPPPSQQSIAAPPHSQVGWSTSFGPPQSQARFGETPPPLSQQSDRAPPHSQGVWPTHIGPPQSQAQLGENPPPGSQQSNGAPPHSQGALPTPPGPSQSYEPNPWFGSSSHVDTAAAPAPFSFKPINHLFSFAAGSRVAIPEPTSPKTAPADGGQRLVDVKKRVAAIKKAAEVVMAYLQGKQVERSDLLTIIDGMLADPEIRSKLPSGLRTLFDEAVSGREIADWETPVIDNFVHATERSIGVVAKVYGNCGWAQNKLIKNPSPMGLISSENHSENMMDPGPSNPTPAFKTEWPFGPTGNPQQTGHSQQDPLAGGPSSSQPLNAQPLTEANLRSCLSSGPSKGKAKDGGSGVVRTGRGAVRSAPYPRRASGETRVSVGHPHGLGDSAFSVHSASTSRPQIGAGEQQLLESIFEEPAGQLDARIYEDPNIKKALEVLDEIQQKCGSERALDVFQGFRELACYKLLGALSSDLISEAHLEHSGHQIMFSEELALLKSKQPLVSMPSEIVRPPNQVIVDDPTLGSGEITYVPYFKPK